MIRPEVKEALMRWRGVIASLVVAALGLWWLVTGFGFIPWIGAALLVAGIALALAALQKMRFSQGRGGPGVVEHLEGQVVYYGPDSGGVVALTELYRLELDPSRSPAVWRMYQTKMDTVEIPVTAEGADALFDIFSRLPGINTTRMIDELRSGAHDPVTIWRKDHLRLH